jgi:integrase
LKAVGLQEVRVHDLQQTAGTLATAAGATVKESMARLGHSSVTASLTYQHIAAGRDAEITANHMRG